MNTVVEFKREALAAYDQLTAGQDELHAAAVASLESLIERNIEVAINTVEAEEPSELVKDMQDIVLEISVIIEPRPDDGQTELFS